MRDGGRDRDRPHPRAIHSLRYLLITGRQTERKRERLRHNDAAIPREKKNYKILDLHEIPTYMGKKHICISTIQL